MLCHSCGKLPTNPLTSSCFDESSWIGSTFTPGPNCFSISIASAFSLSIRRAVRIRRKFFGDALANSTAVLRPMPEDAPVMTTVLPPSRFVELMVEGLNMERMWTDCILRSKAFEVVSARQTFRSWSSFLVLAPGRTLCLPGNAALGRKPAFRGTYSDHWKEMGSLQSPRLVRQKSFKGTNVPIRC